MPAVWLFQSVEKRVQTNTLDGCKLAVAAGCPQTQTAWLFQPVKTIPPIIIAAGGPKCGLAVPAVLQCLETNQIRYRCWLVVPAGSSCMRSRRLDCLSRSKVHTCCPNAAWLFQPVVHMKPKIQMHCEKYDIGKYIQAWAVETMHTHTSRPHCRPSHSPFRPPLPSDPLTSTPPIVTLPALPPATPHPPTHHFHHPTYPFPRPSYPCSPIRPLVASPLPLLQYTPLTTTMVMTLTMTIATTTMACATTTALP